MEEPPSEPREPGLLIPDEFDGALSKLRPFVLEFELVLRNGPFFLSLSLLASGLGSGSECIRAMEISSHFKSLMGKKINRLG